MKVLAVLLVPWSIRAFVVRFERYAAEPWRAVVGFGTASIILGTVFVVNRRKGLKLEAAKEQFERLVADRTLG